MNNYTQEERNAIKALENEVLEILRDESDGYENPFDFYRDVINHGCISGTVSALMSYYDTSQFYKRHETAIDLAFSNWLDEGFDLRNSDRWHKDDPFCKDIYNRNLVVWAVFEDLTTAFYANRIK